MSDEATVGPTQTQLTKANLVALTELNGKPVRSWDARHQDFPPTTVYVTRVTPPPPPPVTTFTAKQTGANEITVSWSGVEPVELARDGTDTSNSGPWNTGPLVNQPLAGSFAFDYMIPGYIYTLTLTYGEGLTLTTTCTIPVTPLTTLALGMNGGTDAASLAQMKTLGVKYVRTQITWNYHDQWDAEGGIPFYNADGTFNTAIATKANAIKTLAATYGITVLFLIDGFISSATTLPVAPANHTPGLPYSPEAYAEACAWFCSQVKGAHIEGPNEPNGYAQWNGSVPFLASDYAIAMPLVYAQCKAADPTCFVHIAPVSGVNQTNVTWRAALLKALPNFAQSIDYDGWHFYTYPSNEPAVTLAGQTQTFMAAAGVTKPSWVTEGGFPSNTANSGNGLPEMTEASQATQLVALIQLTVGIALIEAFFVYCFADYANKGQVGGDGWWGVVHSMQSEGDTNPKPAFAAVQALFA